MGEEGAMFKNMISYCSECTNTVYWDFHFKPWILKSADPKAATCKNSGCKLVVLNMPEDGCDFGKYSLIRLALIESGFSEESTDIAVDALSAGFEAKAA
jgi:hypothetical protein